MADVQEALDAAAAWIDQIDGVQAVGQGENAEGQPCVNVHVVSASLVNASAIPKEIKGVPVRIIDDGGPIQAQGKESSAL